MKQIEEIYIRDCNSVTSFPFSILPTTLKRIQISGCPKLKLEVPIGEMSMFVEYLSVEECGCVDDISPEFLPTARQLSIRNCQNVTRFLIPTATETLRIENCENVEKLSVACGGAAQLTSLNIWGCKKLKCLPENMQELLPSLKGLCLSYCPEIEGELPFNLQKLYISKCKKLVNGRKEWHLQRLTELWIFHDGSDEDIEHWELPSSITRLEVSNLKTLSSQHLKSLTSLQYLDIEGNLSQIQSQGQLSSLSHLTSLQTLQIRNLQSLAESALPSSLSHLTISGCPNLQSLSESALPSSISHLTISDCPNLQSLAESALPSSLSHLNIYICPNLHSLPLKGMPSSLSNLSIFKCPLLTPLLEFDKGEYWPQIAHIPTIDINGELL